MKHNPKPLFVKPMVAAAMLGVGRNKIYEMLADGSLPSTRLGVSIRVPLSAIEKLERNALEGEGRAVETR